MFGYLICCVAGVFTSLHAASTVVYLWRSVKLTLVKNSRKEKGMPMLLNIKNLSEDPMEVPCGLK